MYESKTWPRTLRISLCAGWRVATTDIQIGQLEIKAGLASIAGSYLMTLHARHTHDVQLSLSGELISGLRAFDVGLVTELATSDAFSMTQSGFGEACVAGIRAQLECYAQGMPQAVMRSFLDTRAKKRELS
jgi:enoyl-CoA hydratase